MHNAIPFEYLAACRSARMRAGNCSGIALSCANKKAQRGIARADGCDFHLINSISECSLSLFHFVSFRFIRGSAVPPCAARFFDSSVNQTGVRSVARRGRARRPGTISSHIGPVSSLNGSHLRCEHRFELSHRVTIDADECRHSVQAKSPTRMCALADLLFRR